VEVADRLEDFRRVGVDVLAVSMSQPAGVAMYLANHPMPVPVLADPDRRLYAALELGRTTWARLLRPSLLWKYLKLIARGGKVRRIPEGEDALQVGGDFLVLPDRQVVWAYRGTDPTDRPSVDRILQAIRESIPIER
jgi:hypothetical protein